MCTLPFPSLNIPTTKLPCASLSDLSLTGSIGLDMNMLSARSASPATRSMEEMITGSLMTAGALCMRRCTIDTHMQAKRKQLVTASNSNSGNVSETSSVHKTSNDGWHSVQVRRRCWTLAGVMSGTIHRSASRAGERKSTAPATLDPSSTSCTGKRRSSRVFCGSGTLNETFSRDTIITLNEVWRETLEPACPEFFEYSLTYALSRSALMRQAFTTKHQCTTLESRGSADVDDDAQSECEHEYSNEIVQRVARAQHQFITDMIALLTADEPQTVIDSCVELGKRHAGMGSSRQTLFWDLQVMSMMESMHIHDASTEQCVAFERFMRFIVHHMQTGYRMATERPHSAQSIHRTHTPSPTIFHP